MRGTLRWGVLVRPSLGSALLSTTCPSGAPARSRPLSFSPGKLKAPETFQFFEKITNPNSIGKGFPIYEPYGKISKRAYSGKISCIKSRAHKQGADPIGESFNLKILFKRNLCYHIAHKTIWPKKRNLFGFGVKLGERGPRSHS